MKEIGAAILLLCLVSGCGGGGGGSSAPPTPPPPSVNISGNAGSYWIDEEIEIRFSTSNMDRNTISYTVSNFEEGYDFTLDSSNGVFKTITGQFTDPGEYSLTVTATDGAGKTASRSFQFDVHTVITGRVEVEYQNDGRLPYARVSRDGNFAFGSSGGPKKSDKEAYGKVIHCFVTVCLRLISKRIQALLNAEASGLVVRQRVGTMSD